MMTESFVYLHGVSIIDIFNTQSLDYIKFHFSMNTSKNFKKRFKKAEMIVSTMFQITQPDTLLWYINTVGINLILNALKIHYQYQAQYDTYLTNLCIDHFSISKCLLDLNAIPNHDIIIGYIELLFNEEYEKAQLCYSYITDKTIELKLSHRYLNYPNVISNILLTEFRLTSYQKFCILCKEIEYGENINLDLIEHISVSNILLRYNITAPILSKLLTLKPDLDATELFKMYNENTYAEMTSLLNVLVVFKPSAFDYVIYNNNQIKYFLLSDYKNCENLNQQDILGNYIHSILTGNINRANKFKGFVRNLSDIYIYVNDIPYTVGGVIQFLSEFSEHISSIKKFILLCTCLDYGIKQDFGLREHITTQNYISMKNFDVKIFKSLLELNPDWNICENDHAIFKSVRFHHIRRLLDLLTVLYPESYYKMPDDTKYYIQGEHNKFSPIGSFINAHTSHISSLLYECSICLSEFDQIVTCCSSSSFHGHTTCKTCMTKWLVQNKTCPISRTILI